MGGIQNKSNICAWLFFSSHRGKSFLNMKSQNAFHSTFNWGLTYLKGQQFFYILYFLGIILIRFTGHGFILVYSISSRQSLEELKPILELIGEVELHRQSLRTIFSSVYSPFNSGPCKNTFYIIPSSAMQFHNSFIPHNTIQYASYAKDYLHSQNSNLSWYKNRFDFASYFLLEVMCT